MTQRARPVAPGQPPIELSEAAQEASAWLRLLARGLRTFRIYRGDNPVVVQVRTQLSTSLADNLSRFGGWQLRFTPNRIFLEDEPVIQPEPPAPGEDAVRQPHHDLPFIFYRDGIRKVTLIAGIPTSDILSLFEALSLAGHGPNAQDDLVTLLWQANLTHVKIESVPLEHRWLGDDNVVANAFPSVRAAIEWSVDHDDVTSAATIAAGVDWSRSDGWSEGARWCERLSEEPRLTEELRAQLFLELWWLHPLQRRDRKWGKHAVEATEAWRRSMLEG